MTKLICKDKTKNLKEEIQMKQRFSQSFLIHERFV